MNLRYKPEQMEALLKALKTDDVSDGLRQVVKKYTARLDQVAKRKAVFHGHLEWVPGKGKVFVRPTGTLRRSISPSIHNGGAVGRVAPHTDYAAYVELGTRFMEAQPYLKPAVDEIKDDFIAAIADVMKGEGLS